MTIMKNNVFQNLLSNLLSVIFIIALFASCDDKIPGRGEAAPVPAKGMVMKTFAVELSPLTKTAIAADGEFRWLAGDQLSVFDNKSGFSGHPVYVYNNTVSAEVEASASLYYSLYPYSGSMEYDAATGNIVTFLPYNQFPAPGNMDKRANLMFAASRSGENRLAHNNMCAILKFSIADEDIAEMRFEGLKGEALAGRAVIKKEDASYNLVASDAESRKAVKIVSDSDSHLFVKDASYYFFVLPQSFEEGFKATLTKKDGSVGVYKHDGKIAAQRNAVTDLGAIKCAEYKSNLKSDYETKGKIVIGGKEYNIKDMPAFEVAEQKLSENLNGKDKDGIYFLNPDIDYDISSVNISSKVVIVSNDASKPSKIIFAEDKPVLLGKGELVLSNIILDNAARGGYTFGPDKEDGAVTTAFGRLVIEKSEILNVCKPLLYYDLAGFGVKEIACKGNKIQINSSENKDIPLFNIWKSDSKSYVVFDFSDNVYYSKEMADVQLFNGSDKSANPYSDLDIVFNNNIVYNIHSSKSMVKASTVKSLSIEGNLFYVKEKKSNDFFRLYVDVDLSIISGGTNDDKNTSLKKNFAYALGGFGWTNYANKKNRKKYFVTNWVDTGSESPFEETDPDTGNFKLKENFSQYGPKN